MVLRNEKRHKKLKVEKKCSPGSERFNKCTASTQLALIAAILCYWKDIFIPTNGWNSPQLSNENWRKKYNIVFECRLLTDVLLINNTVTFLFYCSTTMNKKRVQTHPSDAVYNCTLKTVIFFWTYTTLSSYSHILLFEILFSLKFAFEGSTCKKGRYHLSTLGTNQQIAFSKAPFNELFWNLNTDKAMNTCYWVISS